ncbi:hypothetical protein [Bradyrhizobium sp. AUGA SZCCT0283]|uniref:hypothetical protein n=1 Tax=Bradyrhizobium sp. AUGA SZCCT0283 TaxID=2807671 RepID=UPI001BADB64E|nr:hypothetical protein [Bradyrhizobium sp. AUGA SZCCT0283]MBR1277485.1 hypothetical protein [Bradyrhizobium sp. AUGA SZCCT0283]
MIQADVPFQELAWSFYLFISRLDAELVDSSAEHVLFFSREGKLLKEMFDVYQGSALPSRSRARTHYFEVSRRSTFLLSCRPLEAENFSNLFRQYRKISLADFLKSLSLEEHLEELADDLRLPGAALEEVSDDLPTDPRFKALMRSGRFRQAYSDGRVERSKAFSKYLFDTFSGSIPKQLHVVDVGWKGTIQDNLFAWFDREFGEDAKIAGHYLGLIAGGTTHNRNQKKGLLFSYLHRSTPAFYAFNENRSLFEIVLPADHGSPRQYIIEPDGTCRILHDCFREREIIHRIIWPISRAILANFNLIHSLQKNIGLSLTEIAELAAHFHKRLVFRPTAAEIEWMESTSHFENFGVFQESRFVRDRKMGLAERFKYTWQLVSRRQLGEAGFWPWLAIRQQALPGMSFLYRCYRIQQMSFRK